MTTDTSAEGAAATVHEARLWRDGDWTARVVKNEDDPHALLAAVDAAGDTRASVRVAAGFRLSAASAEAWVADGFRKPR